MMLLILMMTLPCLPSKLLPQWLLKKNRIIKSEEQSIVLGHNIVNHNKKEGELRPYNDYFAENPKFTKSQFQKRFD